MASKQYNKLIPLIALWVFVGFCEGLDLSGILQGASSSSGAAASMPSCLQKLLPCESFLKSPDSPPSSCCTPLTGMISDDPDCICQVFDNPDVLNSLNVTQDQLLKLPKACGSDADISICKKDAESPNGSTPTTPSSGPSSSSSNSNNTSTAKSGANVINYFGGSGLALAACLITGSIISAS
ncbi:hypothetical protein FNV43_RR20573 [Rhamnella rubrinervis]|uniref:Bifunctional inhibitor/plant lipid transfer protein/seed storage helical domain-containing protein n=1 Tax=Rhamnella rubrinervis TaxID=2594499 RepID=A0A8K0GQL2_9ROSA|nr:hypothetical protein FNV43_RR20573 [Rhamnella rubrinervis]